MSRVEIRTCSCSASDSSIIARLPSFIAAENAGVSAPALAGRGLSSIETRVNHHLLRPRERSGEDVRRIRIENQLDLVLQPQLPLRQVRQLELVDRPFRRQNGNLLVELPMFGAQ